ncbi:MAG: hypothetical protein JWM33_770 [Caulobacteraceae bacterium]|nr:hypothetical protein [Caulobacteraceae bacterium]
MTGPLPALIIAAGLLVAAAAPAPSGPDALPAQVAGVIGSGDQLSLQLRATEGAPARIVHPGEEAIDGWTLSGLTNTVATLSKGDQSRTIGLNPTGAVAVARPFAPPSTVRVTIDGLTPEMAAILALSDEELLAQSRPGVRQAYQSMTGGRGLTAEEARRLDLYQTRFSLLGPLLRDAAQAKARAGQQRGETSSSIISNDPDSALLFGQDYIDLVGRQRQYDYQQAQQQYQASVSDGVRMVWVPNAPDSPAHMPYPGGMVVAGNTPQGVLYVAQPPIQPGPVDQPYRYPPTPILTADMVASLTSPDGAAAGPAIQADALAANQQLLSDLATWNTRQAAITYYGPFGVVPSPYIR